MPAPACTSAAASIVQSQASQSADDQRRATKLESVAATSCDEMRDGEMAEHEHRERDVPSRA